MKRFIAGVGVVSCGAVVVALAAAAPASADPAPTLPSAFVTEVVDGDSVRVVDVTRGAITVRIAGADAPELNECYGPQSRDFTRSALERQLVAVIVDPSLGGADASGELPAYIVRVDGWNHNVEATRAGAARASGEVSRSAEIRDAENGARQVGAGLWSANCGTPAQQPRPQAAPQPSGVYYENCDDARARGAAPVLRGQPGYRAGLDRDNDGVGCEPTR
ncbi:excalibur calcium-binding domain-containing protein [Rhodococcus sp. NBC_00294]|uniref:excalibur calcium-binding domain-containing protein n=1 Tax=Rhodococcus sp. NBC_00294 TaxID=2976004 RepID=UPI002E28EB09|nr:excalibur calcium-binding domain-containing protein [Rhodococcus sp. NBC_00294]